MPFSRRDRISLNNPVAYFPRKTGKTKLDTGLGKGVIRQSCIQSPVSIILFLNALNLKRQVNQQDPRYHCEETDQYE
jgi:hypothetical protein